MERNADEQVRLAGVHLDEPVDQALERELVRFRWVHEPHRHRGRKEQR
jgi:hypothetical protein